MMHRRVFALLVPAVWLLAACGGIPLRSLPQLSRLGATILQDDPADFSLAIQVDKRMVVAADAAPVLILKITASDANPPSPMDRRLPLILSSVATSGLPEPGAGRTWLVYTLTPESQQEVLRMRESYRSAKLARSVTISAGIEQEGLAVKNAALATTDWESWLRTSRVDGYFKLWSGQVGDLVKHAQR
jgi:hypothetical protein